MSMEMMTNKITVKFMAIFEVVKVIVVIDAVEMKMFRGSTEDPRTVMAAGWSAERRELNEHYFSA